MKLGPPPQGETGKCGLPDPCQCGKVYAGETQRCMETWVKEQECMQQGVHREVCHRGASVGSATPSEVGRCKGTGQSH